MEQAIRLSPRDPVSAIATTYWNRHLLHPHRRGIARLDSMPVEPFPRSRLPPPMPPGRDPAPRRRTHRARRLEGEIFFEHRHVKAFPGLWLGVPKTRALFEATYFAGLRKAGMPEE